MRRRDRSTEPVQRIYAIGDVHGRFDLFRQLMNIIQQDHASRPSVSTEIVLLGDIVDRGPDSARMVHGCMKLTGANTRFIVLKGNHEETMVQALRGDLLTFQAWLTFGGRETLLSWGVDQAVIDEPATQGDLRTAAKAIGKDVIMWLDSLPLYHRNDGFLFVHAGIRPGIPIDQQVPDDLLWIRETFLESQLDHDVVVVHGHTVVEDGPDVQPNRIGIDTGAYRTDRLTAIGIEKGEAWFLDTKPADRAAATLPHDLMEAPACETETRHRLGTAPWQS